jgi:hypothetical protein
MRVLYRAKMEKSNAHGRKRNSLKKEEVDMRRKRRMRWWDYTGGH